MKRLASLLLVFSFVFYGLLSLKPPTLASDVLSLSIGSVTAYKGDYVEVPIMISNNPGITSISYLRVEFDDSLLEWDTREGMYNPQVPGTWPFTLGSIYEVSDFIAPVFGGVNMSTGHARFTFAPEFNVTGNGILITLRLRVIDTAEEGDISLALTVSNIRNDAMIPAIIPPSQYNIISGKVIVLADTDPSIPLNPDDGTGKVNVSFEMSDDCVNSLIDNNKDGIIEFDLAGTGSTTAVVFSTSAAQALNTAGVTVSFMFPVAEVTLSPDVLKLLAASCKKDGLSLIIVEALIVPKKDLRGIQAAQVKEFDTITSINVFIDGTKINVPLTIRLPYTLKSNETPAAVRVWHMDDDGSLTCLNGAYDPETSMITFTITQQSFFVVGYDPVLLWVNIFDDLSLEDEHYEAIAFMNQHGLMNGYGNGLVGPQDFLTRAQFATLVWSLEGKPVPKGSAWFTDVAPHAWYHDAVQWAAENNIVSGIGNGLFAPDPFVTRQEAMQMLYNYAVVFKGYVVPVNLKMPEYTDLKSISSWADLAVESMVESGILMGFTGNELNPKNDVTRAEAAALFKNFLRFIADEI
jgi:hypothetical protein